MSEADTIFALSSGAGIAGIAVIRISGGDAAAALKALGGELPEARRAVVRALRDPGNGEVIDSGMVLWLPTPGSFTGEDMAELQVHGSLAVIEALLGALERLPGLRPAEAGEFTRRAFRNGRIDLVEAEGIADLLYARTAAQRRQALYHALGGASEQYEGWRAILIGCLARVEAAVDFIDEPGVAEAALADLRPRLSELAASLEAALTDGARAGSLRDGVRVVFLGPPNTGKSSLLNRIAGRSAAIVSPTPGTTRDVIEVPLVLEDIPVILTDTAGLRKEPQDAIEQEGIARTRGAAAAADIRVWVSSPDQEESLPNKPFDSDAVWLLNKADLAPTRNYTAAGPLRVSALTGEGLDAFFDHLRSIVRTRYGHSEQAVVIRSRHRAALGHCLHQIKTVDSRPERLELTGEALRRAANELGRITGRIEVDDLLDVIFRDFCIGK